MTAKFFDAIKKGEREKVLSMIASDPTLVRTRDKDGLSPILTAAYHQQSEIADILVDHTVTITIFEAAATGKRQQIMLMLARNPGLVNVYAEDGFQPLGLAASFGHSEVVDFLINAGAWINSASINKLRVTPLHSAVAGGHVAIARHLLEAGADPNAKQEGDNTPLHLATQNGQLEIIRLLIEYGAKVDARNVDRKTPLDLANEKGLTTAALLLKSGVTKRFRKFSDLP